MQKIAALVISLALILTSCRKDPKVVSPQDYPKEIGTLIVGKCATSGCHNDASYLAANGLNLSTWENLFQGTRSGNSSIIPYRSDYSSFCYFTNIYPDLGISLSPSMPFNDEPLSREEYMRLRDWINAGAPNANGKIKFADDPSRKKFYITNFTCDVVTVLDAATLLPMRYVTVGNKSTTEFPCCVKVSPDKKYWYVSFFTQSGIIQKFDAETDKLVGQINIGLASWNSFEITSDSKYAWVADNTGFNGKLAYVDLDNMALLNTTTLNFQYMSGMVINESLKKIYIGSLFGNFLYKIDITNPLYPVIGEIQIDGSSTSIYTSSLDPINLTLDPLSNKCYVACQKTSEVRVINMQTDAVMATVPLSSSPNSLSFSNAAKKLFVSCPDDSISFAGNRGCINVIDCNSNALQTKINSGWQPYGLTVDDARNVVVVANANLTSNGPAPHHVSGCGGRNGYISFIDLGNLTVIPNKKPEVAVFPYAVTSR